MGKLDTIDKVYGMSRKAPRRHRSANVLSQSLHQKCAAPRYTASLIDRLENFVVLQIRACKIIFDLMKIKWSWKFGNLQLLTGSEEWSYGNVVCNIQNHTVQNEKLGNFVKIDKVYGMLRKVHRRHRSANVLSQSLH